MSPRRRVAGALPIGLLCCAGAVVAAYGCSSEHVFRNGRTGGENGAGQDGGGGESARPSGERGGDHSGIDGLSSAGAVTDPSNGGQAGAADLEGAGGARAGEETAQAGQAGAPGCNAGDKRCSGNTVQTCDDSGHWGSGEACPVTSAVCGGKGTCSSPQSCNGLQKCGVAGGSSPLQTCCASPTLPGGTFDRSNDDQYPATVSPFRLDVFEVTVGRFANFVADYSQDMIKAGDGRNLNNPADPGWDPAWNAKLPADADALKAELLCDADYQSWDADLEMLPINCVSWYVANAFCIWDGGRLPTEAELSYAAVGGDEQRVYPWGATALTSGNYQATYGCNPTMEPCIGTTDLTYVGYNSSGFGKWGQADLAGNVWEWTADFFADPYPQTPCVDCANFTAGSKRKAIRGGAFNSDRSLLINSHRDAALLSAAPDAGMGVRCARAF